MAYLVSDLVDVAKYPIDQDPASPAYVALVKECQRQLSAVGSVDLEGFIRPGLIHAMTAEVDTLDSFHRLNFASPLLSKRGDIEKEYGPGHPALRQFAQDTNAVPGVEILRSTMLRQLYDSPLLTQFLRIVLNRQEMYTLADEYQCINMMYMNDGAARAWHYDGTDCVITLMLQPSLEGGEIEWAPFIRGETPGDERVEDVAQLFDGKWKNVHTKSAAAGTLNLFNGARSMHRVRSTYGGRTRVLAVLSYDDIPNRHFNAQKNVSLYGERVRDYVSERGMKDVFLDDRAIADSKAAAKL